MSRFPSRLEGKKYLLRSLSVFLRPETHFAGLGLHQRDRRLSGVRPQTTRLRVSTFGPDGSTRRRTSTHIMSVYDTSVCARREGGTGGEVYVCVEGDRRRRRGHFEDLVRVR